MTKKLKLIILLLCVLSTLSLLLIPSFADEPVELIPPYPTHMTIMKGANCKTTYIEGELFSTENIYGRVYFSDGTNEFLMTDRLEYLEKGPLSRDTTSITFVYKDESEIYPSVTYSLPITVIPSLFPAPVPVSLTVTSTKAEYLEGEKINPSTFNASITFSDGTWDVINITDCSFYPSLDTPLTPDTTSISVTYQSGETTVTESVAITVKPIVHLDPPWGLEGIGVYEAAPLEDLPGVTLTAYYDEAKTVSRIITDFTIRPAFGTIRPDSNGKSKIIISAGSKSIEADVTVIPIVNYRVIGFNEVYYYGDSCSLENVIVYAIYEDGASIDVTDQVVFNIPETIVAGSAITASHNGYDLKDFINVSLPEGELMIIIQPTKLHYEIGEIFDSTGLSVGVNYSDGTRKFLTADDYTLEVSSILTTADKFVTISYYGISTNISISVGDEAYIVSLSIIGSPDTLTYFEGNTLNTSGLLIQATFSDGTFSIIDHRTLTFTPALNEPLTIDVTSVKISANDGTDKYCEVVLPISVAKKVPTALIATSQPKKLTYAEGEAFDPDGLALSLLFNDMSSIVPSSFSFSPEFGTSIVLLSNATEKYIIYAIYEYEGVEYTYPIEITVTPAEVENLLVSRQPIKTKYEVGEKFDPSGLELILVYKDRTLSSPKVPDGYFSFSPSTIAKTTKEITVSFRGISVAIPITVNGAETEPPITTEPQPPETTTPPETTIPPEETSTDVTTEEAEATTEPETSEPEITTESETTTSPEDITTEDEETTDDSGSSGPVSLLSLWIIVIVVIVVALIALIIYYKKNFT
jgi:hypothetical protein